MRGLFLFFSVLAFWLPATAQDGVIKVPSGQLVLPYEALWEDHEDADGKRESWLVLRFLAPQIAKSLGQITGAQAAEDIDHICDSVALPMIEIMGGGIDQVIVTLLDQPAPRGLRDPSVTKFMGAYIPEEGACAWN